MSDARYGTGFSGVTCALAKSSTGLAEWFTREARFVSDTGKMVSGARQFDLTDGSYLTNNSYHPQCGDIVFFSWYKRGTSDHTALVEGLSDDGDGTYTLHLIEGNNPDTVQRRAVPLEEKTIWGYGTPVRRVGSSIRVYSQNAMVTEVANLLAGLGYYTPEPKSVGTFTKSLKKAVTAFQKDEGLKADGAVDADDWLRLIERAGE